AEIRRQAPAPQTIWLFRTESHTLAFHLGRRVRTFVKWQDLDRLASGPEPAYVVMRPEVAAECCRQLTSGQLEEVGTTDHDGIHHEKPLVLLRTRPSSTSSTHVRSE